MGANIQVFLDCVSPYSFFAFLYLLRNRDILKAHDVTLDIVPVFLGGINVATGNKPPSFLPARGKYLRYELIRAKHEFGRPQVTSPSFFPILSLLPQRSMVYIKSHYHEDRFLMAFKELWIAMWEQTIDISDPENLSKVLARIFHPSDVNKILEKAASPEVKTELNDNTKEALEKGAYGCPWHWVRNSDGKEEPFFGSDRYHYIWDFLGIPRGEVATSGRANL